MKSVFIFPLFLASTALAQATPDPFGPEARALAHLVYEGQGTIPYSIREAVADSDNILGVDWPAVPGSEHSTTFYSFGMRDLAPEKLASLIKFKPDMVMYTGADMDVETPSIGPGISYWVHELGDSLTLLVKDVTPAYFTLADPTGAHKGSVTYGAFKDKTGELWVFEECVGSFFGSNDTFIGMHQEHMVKPTHNFIEAGITAYLSDEAGKDSSGSGPSGGSADCPEQYREHYTVGVNRHVDTNISVKVGDIVTISASGTVVLGLFAGESGPEGIQFLPGYSYFPDSPHGCLIGRVRAHEDYETDPWAYIGKGDTWTIKDDGLIELNLNDNDPDNNTGEYDVDITVCHGH